MYFWKILVENNLKVGHVFVMSDVKVTTPITEEIFNNQIIRWVVFTT